MWCICFVACLGVYTYKVNLSGRLPSLSVSRSLRGRSWSSSPQSRAQAGREHWDRSPSHPGSERSSPPMGCTTCTHTAGGACETMKEGKLELKSLGRYFVSVLSHLRTKSHLYIHIYMYIYVCLDLSLYIYACTCTHTETGSYRTSSKTRNQHNKCWQHDLCMSAFMVCISFFFFYLFIHQK